MEEAAVRRARRGVDNRRNIAPIPDQCTSVSSPLGNVAAIFLFFFGITNVHFLLLLFLPFLPFLLFSSFIIRFIRSNWKQALPIWFQKLLWLFLFIIFYKWQQLTAIGFDRWAPLLLKHLLKKVILVLPRVNFKLYLPSSGIFGLLLSYFTSKSFTNHL